VIAIEEEGSRQKMLMLIFFVRPDFERETGINVHKCLLLLPLKQNLHLSQICNVILACTLTMLLAAVSAGRSSFVQAGSSRDRKGVAKHQMQYE
jgi:hypothetical protein